MTRAMALDPAADRIRVQRVVRGDRLALLATARRTTWIDAAGIARRLVRHGERWRVSRCISLRESDYDGGVVRSTGLTAI